MALTSSIAKIGDMEGAHGLGAMQTLSVTSLHSHDQVWVPVAVCVKEGPAWTSAWLRKLRLLASHFTSNENASYGI